MNAFDEAARKGRERAPGQGEFGVEGALRRIARREINRGAQIPEDMIDDLVQDVYLDMVKQSGTYNPDIAGLGAWSGIMMRRKVWALANRKDLLHKARPIEESPLEEEHSGGAVVVDRRAGPEVEMRLKEIRRAVHDLRKKLKSLGRRFEWEAFEAVVRADGLRSVAAAQLRVPTEAIKFAIKRAKSFEPAKRLLKLWEELRGEPILNHRTARRKPSKPS